MALIHHVPKHSQTALWVYRWHLLTFGNSVSPYLTGSDGQVGGGVNTYNVACESHLTSVFALTVVPDVFFKTEFLGEGKALKGTALRDILSLRAGHSPASAWLSLESLCDVSQGDQSFLQSTLTTAADGWRQWLRGENVCCTIIRT